MSTFIGDPLYRPFANVELPANAVPKNEWEAYQLGARAWFDQGAEVGTAKLKADAQKFSSGMIMEGLGLLQLAAGDSDNAVNSFDQAAMLYRVPADSLRATIHEVFQLKALNRTDEAIAVARKALARYNKEPTADVLRVLEAELTFASGSPHDASH
jgi:tetratricopeptide (TPR) repeat protein